MSYLSTKLLDSSLTTAKLDRSLNLDAPPGATDANEGELHALVTLFGRLQEGFFAFAGICPVAGVG